MKELKYVDKLTMIRFFKLILLFPITKLMDYLRSSILLQDFV